MKDSDKNISRRSFLRTGAASIVSAGLGLSGLAGSVSGAQEKKSAGNAAGAEKKPPQINEYRKLGSTGWKVSDISFGNAGMTDPSTLEYAMERGINYVDTARQYYEMEKVVGQIFPEKRGKLFVTTKLMPELITAEVTVDEVLAGIEESLKRLNTDYIDSCLIHSVGDPSRGGQARLENENIYKAFEKAISQGKIRCWGASSHGPKMAEELGWLIENTDIGMIMPGMNMMTKGIEPVLAKAKKKGVAVVAMKSLSAARKIDYSEYMKEGRTARQALIKWLLAQPNIDTIAITMRSFEQINEFVEVSGRPKMSLRERRVLEGYGAKLAHDYCRPGCDGCLKACPYNVPIHDILRYDLYFRNYGREKYAMQRYASLPRAKMASRCLSCTGVCESSCGFGLPVKSKMIDAHSTLTV